MIDRRSINLWIPGKPHALLEKHVKGPMQSIALMSYQETITRAVRARYGHSGLLPITTQVSLEINIHTKAELDIVSAAKPILDALKKIVYADDAQVRSISLRLNRDIVKSTDKGPDDLIEISIAEESSVADVQPYKTLNFLPDTIRIRAVPRMDEPPHSKEGKALDTSSDETKQAIATVRESVANKVGETLSGDLMLSVKLKTKHRKLDLDNVVGFYVRVLEGMVYERSTQIKFLYVTYMDTDIFPGDEGVYLTITSYVP